MASQEVGYIVLPYRGAASTVVAIRDGVEKSQTDLPTRRLAEDICQGLRSKDYLSEYLSIYHFTDANCRYARDPRTVEFVQAPYVVVNELMSGHRPQCDCDDLCSFICALIAIMGGRCRACTVAFQNLFYKGERQYSHVFAQAWEPKSGAWLSLDPVAGPKTGSMLARAVAVKFWPIA